MVRRDDLIKMILKLQRSALNMMLDTMSNIQEKSGRATLAFFEHMSRLPQKNVKTMTRWMDSVKATRAEFNSVTRDNYHNWDNMLVQAARHTGQTTRSVGKPKETGSETAIPHSPPPPELSAQSSPAPGHAKEASRSPAKPKRKDDKKAFDHSPQSVGHAAEATPVPGKTRKKAIKKGSGQMAPQSKKSGKKPPKKG
jgi:hypothetical protein